MKSTIKNRCLILTGLLLGYLANGQAQEAEGLAPAESSSAYEVQPGDLLSISVWKEPELQQEVLVRPDGGISFPLAGDIRAAQRSVEALRLELTERLSRYIPDLVVTVSVQAVQGNKIYVIGQVNRQGEFVMNPQVDVIQALSMAGGTTPFASVGGIRILRRIGGKQQVFQFDFNRVAEGRNLEQNIVLQSGDVVIVP